MCTTTSGSGPKAPPFIGVAPMMPVTLEHCGQRADQWHRLPSNTCTHCVQGTDILEQRHITLITRGRTALHAIHHAALEAATTESIHLNRQYRMLQAIHMLTKYCLHIAHRVVLMLKNLVCPTTSIQPLRKRLQRKNSNYGWPSLRFRETARKLQLGVFCMDFARPSRGRKGWSLFVCHNAVAL